MCLPNYLIKIQDIQNYPSKCCQRIMYIKIQFFRFFELCLRTVSVIFSIQSACKVLQVNFGIPVYILGTVFISCETEAFTMIIFMFQLQIVAIIKPLSFKSDKNTTFLKR